MNYQKKGKSISTKWLTKDLINKFSVLNGAKCFSSGIFFQTFLVFTLAKNYIKPFSDTSRIGLLKSNGISEENIKNITTSENNFVTTFVYHHVLPEKF